MYPLVVHGNQSLAPMFPCLSSLIYTCCPPILLDHEFSSNYFHYSFWYCVLQLQYLGLLVNFSPGRLSVEWRNSPSLCASFFNLDQERQVWSQSPQPHEVTRQFKCRPTNTIDAYPIAIRRTCWIHENFPRTLQGSVAGKV